MRERKGNAGKEKRREEKKRRKEEKKKKKKRKYGNKPKVELALGLTSFLPHRFCNQCPTQSPLLSW